MMELSSTSTARQSYTARVDVQLIPCGTSDTRMTIDRVICGRLVHLANNVYDDSSQCYYYKQYLRDYTRLLFFVISLLHFSPTITKRATTSDKVCQCPGWDLFILCSYSHIRLHLEEGRRIIISLLISTSLKSGKFYLHIYYFQC